MMSTNKSRQPPEAAGLMVDDHSELGKSIGDVLVALDKGNKALSFKRLDLLWVRLAVHIRAEHICLFPAILGAPRANFTGTGGTPWYDEAQRAINVLRHDHDFFMRELSTGVNAMRKHGTVADPVGTIGLLREVRHCVARVETRLQTHNQLEEEQVYTWLDALLGKAERSALTASMRHELENIPQRFSTSLKKDF